MGDFPCSFLDSSPYSLIDVVAIVCGVLDYFSLLIFRQFWGSFGSECGCSENKMLATARVETCALSPGSEVRELRVVEAGFETWPRVRCSSSVVLDLRPAFQSGCGSETGNERQLPIIPKSTDKASDRSRRGLPKRVGEEGREKRTWGNAMMVVDVGNGEGC